MDQIREAREAVRMGAVPGAALEPYLAQCWNCKRRGVAMGFGIVAWWRWWQEPAPDGAGTRWQRRGNKRGSLMMLRLNDAGGYEPGNVYCGTPADNVRDAWGSKPRQPSEKTLLAGSAALRAYMSKRVVGPGGEYPTIGSAAEAAGVARETMSRWAASGRNGWRWG